MDRMIHYWHHDMRCPKCLELGKLRPQHGNYVCDRCDQVFASDSLGHWNKAFEKGRDFERSNGVGEVPIGKQ